MREDPLSNFQKELQSLTMSKNYRKSKQKKK